MDVAVNPDYHLIGKFIEFLYTNYWNYLINKIENKQKKKYIF